jgi:DNA polymerase-1
METEGINLDVPFLKACQTKCRKKSTLSNKKIYETAGEKFNLASQNN